MNMQVRRGINCRELLCSTSGLQHYTTVCKRGAILNPITELVFCWQNPKNSSTKHGFSFLRSMEHVLHPKNTFQRFSTLLRQISRHSSNRKTCNSGRAWTPPYAASHQLSFGMSTHSPRRSRGFGQSTGCGHLPDPRTNPSRRSQQRRQLQA